LNGDLGALFELNVTRAVEAFDDAGGGSAAAYAGAAGIDPGRIVPGTDIVTFRRLEGPSFRVLAPVDGHPVVEEGDSFDLQAGDFLLIGDCEQSSLFRLTGVIHGGGSAVLLREPGAGSHENSPVSTLSDGGKVYGPVGAAGGARVRRVMTETYFIAPGRGADRRGELTNSLWRRAGMAASAELVEGVHDLQVSFGVDARPADGVASVGRYQGFDDIPAGGAVLAVQVRVAAGDASGLRAFGQTFSLRNAG
ncbi:MAG: PilW family protein, partial [Gammaproteobacteria bacterium]|nr:PilW family protein [Gammaproteobacteria bacterium]